MYFEGLRRPSPPFLKKIASTHPVQKLKHDLITDSGRDAVRFIGQSAIDTDFNWVNSTEGSGGCGRENEECVDELHFRRLYLLFCVNGGCWWRGGPVGIDR